MLAAATALASVLTSDQARTTVLDLAHAVTFLVAILVVAHVCDRAGIFAAAGALLGGGGATRLLTVSFVLAAAVTAVLSLDATVVLLTPVVVAAARGTGVSPRPAA